eukprot:Protomagalhaensia_sp_Gyna_25__5071@NODE_575_length_3074_cov_214_350577_g445_i0_p2_GENE_NODE_575_length_3074_cov_214_350577_g445_i0NODE_575_length_3074_cov_214_350577_g445_i0_p2_ORF_typecomplete_len361_score44_77UAA/PF08449_11/2_3e57TPT/PF03151_16/2_4e14EamA/PF00892_20/0_0035EamA/PF00892_20/0_014Nuc_sug_transp/PF04142_15/59Nuc_sug_transp/PF04142_15/5_4e06SLC35F/PF06027_12/5_7e06CRTlike/PF08627_10/0_017LapA_dom/PF06305_11/1_6e03LapA_dom/PF06305_11/0_89LapA_dom/PF06305_11/6_4e03LapA_dom/PF06305_11/
MPELNPVVAPSASNVHTVSSKGSFKPQSKSRLESHQQTLLIIASVLGIYICFLTQGLLQESIYQTTIDGKYFKSPVFLVSANCVCSGMFGFGLLAIPELFRSKSEQKQKRERGSSSHVLQLFKTDRYARNEILYEGFLISLSYVSAMCCTNYSLTKVNYPTQVLVKSAKAVPVVIGGWLMYKKRYPITDYMMVAGITVGLIMFQFAKFKSTSLQGGSAQLAGYIALAGSLFFDGMTGPRQDRLVSRFKVSTGEMMLIVNVFAAPLGLLISLLLEGMAPYALMSNQFSSFVPKVLMFVICGACGQFCVVYVLRTLGSLQLTLITTSRKFFAVLLSGKQTNIYQTNCFCHCSCSNLVSTSVD